MAGREIVKSLLVWIPRCVDVDIQSLARRRRLKAGDRPAEVVHLLAA